MFELSPSATGDRHDHRQAVKRTAVQIGRTEAAVHAGIQGGASLIEITNLVEHVAALRRGEISALTITPPS